MLLIDVLLWWPVVRRYIANIYLPALPNHTHDCQIMPEGLPQQLWHSVGGGGSENPKQPEEVAA